MLSHLIHFPLSLLCPPSCPPSPSSPFFLPLPLSSFNFLPPPPTFPPSLPPRPPPSSPFPFPSSPYPSPFPCPPQATKAIQSIPECFPKQSKQSRKSGCFPKQPNHSK